MEDEWTWKRSQGRIEVKVRKVSKKERNVPWWTMVRVFLFSHHSISGMSHRLATYSSVHVKGLSGKLVYGYGLSISQWDSNIKEPLSHYSYGRNMLIWRQMLTLSQEWTLLDAIALKCPWIACLSPLCPPTRLVLPCVLLPVQVHKTLF